MCAKMSLKKLRDRATFAQIRADWRYIAVFAIGRIGCPTTKFLVSFRTSNILTFCTSSITRTITCACAKILKLQFNFKGINVYLIFGKFEYN